MSTLAERMDGDYRPPILQEPVGGPIPTPNKPDPPDPLRATRGTDPATESE